MEGQHTIGDGLTLLASGKPGAQTEGGRRRWEPRDSLAAMVAAALAQESGVIQGSTEVMAIDHRNVGGVRALGRGP